MTLDSMNPEPRQDAGDGLRLVALMLCERCIAGEGGECHTPGCALWMNRAPDAPLSMVDDGDQPFVPCEFCGEPTSIPWTAFHADQGSFAIHEFCSNDEDYR